MKRFYKFIKTLFNPLVAFLLPAKVLNKSAYPRDKNRLITVTNHLKWFDPVYLMFRLPGYRRFLSKKEIGKSTFVYKFFKSFGVMFIDREKPSLAMFRECMNTLKAEETLSIFPEGTRNKVNDEVQEIKGGTALFACNTNSDILPIMVYEHGRFFKRNYLYIGRRLVTADICTSNKSNENVDIMTKAIYDVMVESKAILDYTVEHLKEIKAADKKRNAQLKRDYKRIYAQEKRSH